LDKIREQQELELKKKQEEEELRNAEKALSPEELEVKFLEAVKVRT
jgi:hypothetical protein